MTGPEIIALLNLLFRTLGYLMLYAILGFGPGFICGLILANTLFGRRKGTHFDTHQANIKKASDHNVQWSPTHPRWQK